MPRNGPLMQLRRKERKLPHGARMKEAEKEAEETAKSFSNVLINLKLELQNLSNPLLT